ncbi:2-oxo acid dehydrogenase subunit E2 [Skermania sp. ID1734]|uniref:dihydrolipoamide acetyltransferase family protein n=1 Tax=Skermania sp. ID1734 TaxID=2597516 RepID=UPI00117FE14A|nr:dihydrolipoamide acetyltransferase family protein [Skermania sp. ID1734]TSD93965.1 2-oxo acid dehydrogenase subunit E2 [Skermania sp. ID1734]
MAESQVREFRLPDLGEGLTEAEMVTWAVQVGDHVELNQTIAEVETAKALVELPSPYVGEVVELLVAPGATVPVGAPIIRIAQQEGAGDEHPDRQPVLVGYGPGEPPPSRRRRPAMRPETPHQTDGHTPVHGVRRRTAEAMSTSWREIPHVTEFVTIDATATVELVDHLRATPAFANVKLTPLAVVAKAVVLALAAHPLLNSRWTEQEIVARDHVNLGIAVAAPRGLLVPTVKNAHTMTLHQLCAEIGQMVERARGGHASPADMSGGTFTITNVGVFGIDSGTPIINPGEAGILCLGAIAQRPWVVDGQLAVRWVTTLGVSFDHRMIDGAEGSAFLADIAAMVHDPATMLARS